MKYQGKITSLKEQNKTPVTDPIEMQIYKQLGKEFKIIFSKEVTEL